MSKPPHFDGIYYDYWKNKMSTHLRSMNKIVQDVVTKQFIVLDTNNTTPRQKENLQFNYIALNVLYVTIGIQMFDKVKDLEFSYEVWKILEDSYE